MPPISIHVPHGDFWGRAKVSLPNGSRAAASLPLLIGSSGVGFKSNYRLEQTIKRSQTATRREHHSYTEWKRQQTEPAKINTWESGHRFPAYVHEQQDIERAVQTADRFNKIFMRSLRTLANLRRLQPFIINNPNQVKSRRMAGSRSMFPASRKKETS